MFILNQKLFGVNRFVWELSSQRKGFRMKTIFLAALFLLFCPIVCFGLLETSVGEANSPQNEYLGAAHPSTYPSIDSSAGLESQIGKKAEARGVVIVEPGILGKQIFYIDGLQIYCYSVDFPELKIGDKISVKGEFSQSRGEIRLKIKTKDDIKILQRGLSVRPRLIEIKEISQADVGYLLKVKGKIIEKTWPRIFIDDGNEITVYFKSGIEIEKEAIKEGSMVEITGILSKSNDELRLLLRDNDDVKIVSDATDDKSVAENKIQSQISYQTLSSVGTVIDFEKYKSYSIISAIILGAIFIFLLLIDYKNHRKNRDKNKNRGSKR